MRTPEKVHPRELSVDTVSVAGNPVRLLSCEHNPKKMRPKDPWPEIASAIGGSNLVVVEYFQPELEQTAFKTPVLGPIERLDAERDGINGFFNKVGELSIANGSDIAVADIANRPLYSAYYAAERLALPAALAGMIQVGAPRPLDVALLGFIAYMGILVVAEAGGRFIFHPRPQKMDGIFFDPADARRVYTAKALLQTAETHPDKNILYIAPAAHTKRVKRYMENPNSRSFRFRDRLYRSMVGLNRSIRYFRFDQDQSTWQKIASEPIR